MTPWLSILIPTFHKSDTERFAASLENHGSLDGVELVIDDQDVGNREVIVKFERSIEAAQADWIWLANDDLICESLGWNEIFKHCTERFPDQIAIFYPNDMIFGVNFACFPLVNKHVIADLFPMPYHRYKMDDSILDVFPANRRFYLPNVIMRHLNHDINGEYHVNQALAAIDNVLWQSEKPKRDMIRERLCQRY